METNARAKSHANGGDFWFVTSAKMPRTMALKVPTEASDIYQHLSCVFIASLMSTITKER